LILLVQNLPKEVQNSDKIMDGQTSNKKTNNEMRGTHEKSSKASFGLVVSCFSCISWFIVFYYTGHSFYHFTPGLILVVQNFSREVKKSNKTRNGRTNNQRPNARNARKEFKGIIWSGCFVFFVYFVVYCYAGHSFNNQYVVCFGRVCSKSCTTA